MDLLPGKDFKGQEQLEGFPRAQTHHSSWLSELTGVLGYPLEQLSATDGGWNVFRDASNEMPFACILAEHENVNEAIDQARVASFEFVVEGPPSNPRVFHLGPYSGEARLLPRLPSWTIGTRRTGFLSKSVLLLPFRGEQDFRAALRACHDAIYKTLAHDPAAAFDLLMLVMASKILDEQSDTPVYRFACLENEQLPDRETRVQQLLQEAEDWLDAGVGRVSEVPPLGARLTTAILEAFQDYSLSLTADSAAGKDILGTAYEAVVGSTFRGELGSYFTPRTIADFLARMLDVRQGTVLDPACGSGGLLLAAQRLTRSYELPSVGLRGNDLNPRMVRAARVNFLLHGLDPAEVLQGDGLEINRLTDGAFSDLPVDSSWWSEPSRGRFDAVLANPPFAGFEANRSILQRIESAKRDDGAVRSLNRTIPFLEVIVASLKENGLAGVVIPTSVLNAEEESFVRFRRLLLRRVEVVAIVGLPEKAFVHTDCGIHGALLFLRRVAKPRTDYEVFVDWASELGYDRLGRTKRENDFPAIVDRFRNKPWPTGNTFPIAWLSAQTRWDPAWLRIARSLPVLSEDKYLPLTALFEIRDARFSKRTVSDDDLYRYFEVGDADLETGEILRIHTTSGFELKKKGRIRNRVESGDVLLPNHRDSLIAKGAPTGRSAVVVGPQEDGVFTTDRFIVLKPKIEALVLQLILNSKGVRGQIVAQCRGAASLDIRERTLATVLVPRTILSPQQLDEVGSEITAMTQLREAARAKSTALRERIDAEFGAVPDFRPEAWRVL